MARVQLHQSIDMAPKARQAMRLAALDRRGFFKAAAGLAATTAMAGGIRSQLRRTEPVRYPDPDIISIDPRFKYKLGNTPIQRLYTGTLWAEGPAWNGVGRYLLWSDIPNDEQLRRLEDDGHVSTASAIQRAIQRQHVRLRGPTNRLRAWHPQGRPLRAQRQDHRAGRQMDGKLNAPNDAVVHPDGGIWFTDPGYGC